jgi:Pectate lyase superfamily protein
MTVPYIFADASQSIPLAELDANFAAVANTDNIEYNPPFANSTVETVTAKLSQIVSVMDFGAVGNGIADDTAAIQSALTYINSIGGGTVFVPNGTYNISSEIQVYSNTTFTGEGSSSTLYSLNTTRLNGVAARGTSASPFINVHIKNLSIKSSSVFTSGVPNTNTGQGVTLVCCEQSSVENCFVSGWSDGGIFGDGCKYCYLTGNFVNATAQAIGFIAYSRNCYNNIVTNNAVTNTGTFNAIHLEGHFSGSSYNCYFTTIADNTVSSAYNHGINIENAQYTSCVGNTVFETGLITTPQLSQSPWGTSENPAPVDLRSAIFLFGSPYSSVVGNICNGTTNYAVIVGANSSNSCVSGNISYNTGGGLLITDSYGVASTQNVSVGINNWDIFGVDFSGNVGVSNKTLGLTFQNISQSLLPSGGKTLGWYEEGQFTVTAVGSTSSGTATYSVQLGQFTRIGDTVFFSLNIGWSSHTGTGNLTISGLPYPASGLVSRACSIDNNGIASSGAVISAFIPQGGVSYIALRQTNQSTGTLSSVPIQASVPGLVISGQYQV